MISKMKYEKCNEISKSVKINVKKTFALMSIFSVYIMVCNSSLEKFTEKSVNSFKVPTYLLTFQ